MPDPFPHMPVAYPILLQQRVQNLERPGAGHCAPIHSGGGELWAVTDSALSDSAIIEPN